jgi:mRNA interferase MazF
LSGSKVRPAVIVSRDDRPGNDVVLVFVSSIRPSVLLPSDLLVENSDPEFAATGFKTTSVVKCDKLATVERKIILGEIGSLPITLMQQVSERLKYALALDE